MYRSTIESNVEAYEAMRSELEQKHLRKWALVESRHLINVHETLHDALREAIQKFGRDGTFLIRNVTAHPFLVSLGGLCSVIMSAALPARAIWMAASGLYPSAAIELR